MTRLIAAVLFGIALLCPLAAQAGAPPPRDEAAVRLALSERFIAALQTDQMSTMMSQMVSSMTPPTEGMSQAESDAVRRAVTSATSQMLPALFEAMAPVYADIFTLEELTALVAFYESDIGRSMMTKSYEAAPRVTAIVMDMMPGLMRGMVDSMCKDLGCSAAERAAMEAEINRQGGGPAPATPAKPK